MTLKKFIHFIYFGEGYFSTGRCLASVSQAFHTPYPHLFLFLPVGFYIFKSVLRTVWLFRPYAYGPDLWCILIRSDRTRIVGPYDLTFFILHWFRQTKTRINKKGLMQASNFGPNDWKHLTDKTSVWWWWWWWWLGGGGGTRALIQTYVQRFKKSPHSYTYGHEKKTKKKPTKKPTKKCLLNNYFQTITLRRGMFYPMSLISPFHQLDLCKTIPTL